MTTIDNMTSNSNIQDLIKQYTDKTIAALDFIIRNDHTHTNDQITAAKQVIEGKRSEWKAKNMEASKKIDQIIRRESWFDFHVLSFDGYKLTIGGSIDLTYSHTLEVIFEDIFFVSGFFRGWHSDTSKTVFEIPENENEMNKIYETEQYYQLFTFKTEDYTSDIIIAANSVSFNTDTVYYYDVPDLKKNERIADFVKKKSTL